MTHITPPKSFKRLFAVLLLVTASHLALAEPILRTDKLAEGVYALVGPTTNRDPQNLGNNANFGVIVTPQGVVLIDSGATWQGAQMIHRAIRAITEQPVVLVINTGGQDHRWMGNAYFQSLGARVITSNKAVVDQKARLQDQLTRLHNLVGEAGMAGSQYSYADQTFDQELDIEVGGVALHIVHAGHAHTPGDSYVWLPQQGIVFSGDIVYLDRMLGVGSQSAHKTWISAFQQMAKLQPRIVVPGHGNPADVHKAKRDTLDYLQFLRQAVQALIDDGYGMEDIRRIDQSRFNYLANFDSLSGRNAQRVFEEIEWE